MNPNGPKTTKMDVKELIHLYQNSFNTAYLDGGLSFNVLQLPMRHPKFHHFTWDGALIH